MLQNITFTKPRRTFAVKRRWFRMNQFSRTTRLGQSMSQKRGNYFNMQNVLPHVPMNKKSIVDSFQSPRSKSACKREMTLINKTTELGHIIAKLQLNNKKTKLNTEIGNIMNKSNNQTEEIKSCLNIKQMQKQNSKNNDTIPNFVSLSIQCDITPDKRKSYLTSIKHPTELINNDEFGKNRICNSNEGNYIKNKIDDLTEEQSIILKNHMLMQKLKMALLANPLKTREIVREVFCLLY